MIYGQVFAAGSVTLTRASKALHSDTQRALYRHGVYRIHIGRNREWNSIVDSPTDWETHAREAFPDRYTAKVQNLQVTISFDYYEDNKLSALALGSSLGTRCRVIHAQLAKSLVSCTNYDAVFPGQRTISRTGFPIWKDNSTEFLDGLSTVAFRWYLESRLTSGGRRRPPSEYEAEDVASLAQFFGFIDGCFPKTQNST